MQLFHGKRADLNARFDFLIMEIKKSNEDKKLYVAVKGDILDEMLAVFINDAGLGELLRRQDQGQYVFGTKKISAKILNSQLIIRVGGGYCHIEEFIKQYSRIEMIKMQTQHNLKMQFKKEQLQTASGEAQQTSIMQLTVDQPAGTTATATQQKSPRNRQSKSPRWNAGKSPRMSTGGFSPQTVGKVISQHQFLQAMEQEMQKLSLENS